LLARFREEHPGVEMRLSLGNREALVRQLQGNEVDLAVMGRPPRELDTRAEPFAAHPHAVVAGAQHRLAQVEEIPPSALAGEGFIVREEGSGTRAAMEQFFREHSLRPPVVMEMGSNETIKQAVIANMGLSFLSLHTLGLELERDLLRVVPSTPAAGAPLAHRQHARTTLSPAAEAFHISSSSGRRLSRPVVPAELACCRQRAHRRSSARSHAGALPTRG
jgi:DNA-binding transcriptional LysR family regulator